MLLKVTLFIEQLPTLVTLKLDPGVNVFMLDETRPLVEHFVALVAVELFSPCVHVDVLLVAAPVCECPATLLTGVHPRLRVDVGVSREVAFHVKHFPALLTFVLLLPRVDVHVSRIITLGVNGAVTHRAFILMLVGVFFEVFRKVGLLIIHLLTKCTLVLLLLRVHIYVPFVTTVQSEGLPTLLTAVALGKDMELFVSVEIAF